MINLKSFWADESGVIVSAELVTIATLGVVGMTVGLSTMATAVNAELTDVARAFRSLNQSYRFSGFSSCRAFTAGSYFTQVPVEQSLASLCVCGPAGPVGPVSNSGLGESLVPDPVVVTPAEEKIPLPPEAPVTPVPQKSGNATAPK